MKTIRMDGVLISLVFPDKSPVGRDYVAGIDNEVGFRSEKSDRYTSIKDSFFGFLVDFFIA